MNIVGFIILMPFLDNINSGTSDLLNIFVKKIKELKVCGYIQTEIVQWMFERMNTFTLHNTHLILYTEQCILHTKNEHWMQNNEHWTLSTKHWKQNTKYWKLLTANCTLNTASWTPTI